MSNDMFEHALSSSTAGARKYLDSEDVVPGGPTEFDGALPDAASLAPEAALLESDRSRGLALHSIQLHKDFPWYRFWAEKTREVYWISYAFDLSGEAPVVLPPTAVKARVPDRVKVGETLVAGWGEGAPMFGPRPVTGALFVYLTLMDADPAKHIGETLDQIYDDLKGDSESLLERLSDLVKNPGKVGIEEVLGMGAAALRPIATVLEATGDDYIGLYQGVFEADKDWSNQLVLRRNDATVTLSELGD